MPVLVLALAVGTLTLAQPAFVGQPATADASKTPAKAADPYHVETVFNVGGEGGWDYLTLDPEGNRLFVPRGTHTMVIDTRSGKVLGDIADTAGVHGVALAPGLGKGFTSNGRAGTVTVFDLTSYKTIGSVKAGENPDAILFEPTTKRVFVYNGKSKDATVFGADDLKVAGTIPLGGKPEFSATDGTGTVFVNIEDTSELLRINAKSMKVEARWKLAPGEEPSGLAFDVAHKHLFAVCANQKMIAVDAESGKVLGSPAIGKNCDGAAFDATGGFALASNGDGTMTAISTKDEHFESAQTLTTAPRARTITIDPASRRIYLPTAEFEAAKEPSKDGKPARPVMKPGSFKIVVVAPSRE